MQAVPGSALEVIETEFFFQLLMSLLANPSRLDGGRQGAQVGLRRQIGEIVFSSTLARERNQAAQAAVDLARAKGDTVIIEDSLAILEQGMRFFYKEFIEVKEEDKVGRATKILTLAEGEITELHVGLKGTMNALFLKDLAHKTSKDMPRRKRRRLQSERAC